MEPKGSLPCSKGPATGHYHEREESGSLLPITFLYIFSNIVLPANGWIDWSVNQSIN